MRSFDELNKRFMVRVAKKVRWIIEKKPDLFDIDILYEIRDTDFQFKKAVEGMNLKKYYRQHLPKVLADEVAKEVTDHIRKFDLNTEEVYRKVVDRALIASRTSGYAGVRSTLRSFTGIHANGRRVDVAVDQNINHGLYQGLQKNAELTRIRLDYDAMELTAHPDSAPDHEPAQGRVYLVAEYDKMQAGADFEDIEGRKYTGFPRQIATWNCRHLAIPFKVSVTKRNYSNTILDEWAERNARGLTFEGKHYTNYGASQLMRKFERDLRRAKEVEDIARYAGDNVLRRQSIQAQTRLRSRYYALSKASGQRLRHVSA